jgi:hypothetical protein
VSKPTDCADREFTTNENLQKGFHTKMISLLNLFLEHLIFGTAPSQRMCNTVYVENIEVWQLKVQSFLQFTYPAYAECCTD